MTASDERVHQRRDPPPVTLDDAPADAVLEPPPSRPVPALVVVLVLLLAAVALALRQPVTDPSPPPPVDASLRLVGDRVFTSSGGILVVPVEIATADPLARLDGVLVWAQPVRSTPTHNGGRRLDARGSARFATLLQPDCAVIRSWGVRFDATVSVRLHRGAGPSTEVVLDLARHPVVAQRVAAVCALGT